MKTPPPARPRPSSWGLVVTLLALVVLLVVPAAVWHRSESYRREVDRDVEPARLRVRKAISVAEDARSTAFYYLFTLDETYASHYRLLRTQWRELASDNDEAARAGAPVLRNWRTGKGALSDWFVRYANRYVSAGEQTHLAESDTYFQQGKKSLQAAALEADRAAAGLQGKAASLSRAEFAITGALAATCLLVALLAWQDARMRRELWRREQETAERLQLAVTETNHRVKNNLQVIAALLEMKLMDSGQSVPCDDVRDVVRQVQAVASVHDFLTHGLRSDVVAGGPMLHRLVELAAGPAGLEAELESAQGTLNVRQATAVALITTELLLNAGKHGATRAQVRLEAGDTTARLRVADNGPGFGPGFGSNGLSTVGLSLVRTLAERDLEGRVRFGNEQGAVVEVTFPVGAETPAAA